MNAVQPARGELWYVDLDPTRGHEQAGERPALVISVDGFNYGPAGLVIVLPLTRTQRHIPLYIPVEPPEGGVAERLFVMGESIRCVAKERLRRRMGQLGANTMAEVEDRLRIVLGL